MNPNEIPTPRTDLKSCPFCGSLAKETHWTGHVGCSIEKCPAWMCNLTPEQWNTRDERELHLANQQVEELKREVIEWRDDRQSANAELQQQITKLEAACCEKDELLTLAKNKWYHGHKDCLYDSHDLNRLISKSINSTTSGQRILEDNERMRRALKWIADEYIVSNPTHVIAMQALNPTNQPVKEKE